MDKIRTAVVTKRFDLSYDYAEDCGFKSIFIAHSFSKSMSETLNLLLEIGTSFTVKGNIARQSIQICKVVQRCLRNLTFAMGLLDPDISIRSNRNS